MSRSAIAACLVASLAACRGAGSGPAGPDDSGEPLVAARFVVLDSISAVVIPGATVLAGSRQGVTDADGQVTLLVPRGPTQVSAFVAGYDAVTIEAFTADGPRQIFLRPSAPRVAAPRAGRDARTPFEPVAERERMAPPMTPDEIARVDLEMLLRRIIREESGLTPVVPADRWRGGHMVLRPGTPGLQEKSWPIETFFHKVVMLRNRLRTLEQQLNAADLPEDLKVRLQGYITGCYGSLTSFNVLFADETDQFKGAGGE